MTVTRQMQYPGDPPARVELMFGAEFTAKYQNRGIKLIDIDTGQVLSDLPVEEVVCDSCNALITATDPCCLQEENRLYCWPCFLEWVRPYIPKAER